MADDSGSNDRDAMIGRLRSQEARFRAVAETAVDGIITAGGDSRILYANPAAHEIFGFDAGSMAGMPLTDLMPARYRDRHLAGMSRFLERGEGPIIGRRVELEGLRSDGTEFPIRLSVAAWEEDDEARFTAILQDITARHRLEAERDQKARELERSNKQLEEFAYVVSHDLQSPLRHVTAFSQLLERSLGEDIPVEARRSMASIRQAAERMRRLIRSLLAVGRIQQTPIDAVPVPLADVMAQVTQELKEEIEADDVQVNWQDLPVVQGDRQLLEQVFINLVQNAIRHRSDRPPRVDVDASQGDGYWKIQVRDTGKGFDPDQEERIFEMFRRLDPGSSGSGVGLALCRAIIERHGGTITAQAEPGKGATFTIMLPGGDLPDDP